MDSKAPDWRDAARLDYQARRAAAVKRRDQAGARLKRIREKFAEAEAEIDELDRGAKVFGLIPDSQLQADLVVSDGQRRLLMEFKSASSPVSARQFKDFTVEALEKHYPRPVKAAEIQQWAEAQLRRGFHWKTAGMTLYRLKKDGTARREGQNWFFVPPEERVSSEGLEDLL
jgi:hypothetical protein